MARVERSIEVNAPIEDCYRVLKDFERYPQIFTAIRHVKKKGDPNVWNFAFEMEPHRLLHCDVEFDPLRGNQHVLSWHTIRDADIPCSGAITMQTVGPRKTHIHLVEEYIPPEDWDEETQRTVEQQEQRTLEEFKIYMEKAAVGTASRQVEKPKGTEPIGSRSRVIAPDDLPGGI